MPSPNPDRLAVVHSHLGPDALLLAELNGTEGLSRLFSFELSLLSERRDIAFSDVVGKGLTVAIEVAGKEHRYLHGIVSSFSQKWIAEADGSGFDLSLYTARLVPRLWLLTRSRASRIFQDLSVPEIAQQILGEREIGDVRFDLESARYPKREYCVQYRETEYEFLARLLEDEGLYYYFEHEEGKHTWVLADGSFAHKACPVLGSARYRAGAGDLREGAVITDLVMGQQIRSDRFVLKDFDFQQPELDLSVTVDGRAPGPTVPGGREIYDYPGTHLTLERGDHLSTVRMEEEDAQVTTLSGTSLSGAFSSGFLFTLESHGRAELDGKQFLLTSIEHRLRQPGLPTQWASPGAEADPDTPRYRNRFQCIPSGTPFRPQRVTPKPTVQGPQTAIVVGPKGTDIYTDKFGRVKVQFHWDREGRGNEGSSCWVRVSQVWAGHGWGGMHIPHVGHEVIVNFLEGDPDRPLITGRVYHAGNPLPETLPDNQRKSILRDDYGNELIFDASPGDEHIRLHSPHHNSTLTLGRSFGGFCADDHFEAQGGNMVELGMGNKYEAFLGAALALAAGMSTEASIGLAHEFRAGGKFDFLFGVNAGIHIGPEFKYHKGPTVQNSDSTIASVSKQHNILSAREKVNLIGGAGTASPATSIIEADAKRVSMSIGENKDPDANAITEAEKFLAVLIPGIVGGLSLVLMGASTGFAEAEDVATKAAGLTVVTTLEAALILAELIGYAVLWKHFEDKVAPVSHRDDPRDKVNAVVTLEEKGWVDVFGTKRVTVGVEGDILARLGKGGRPPVPPKGPQLEIKGESISMSGSGTAPGRSALYVDNTGIWATTQKKFDVFADGRISFKCSDFTVNGKNLQVLP